MLNAGAAGLAQDPGNGRRLSYAVLDAATGHVTFDDYQLGSPSATPDQSRR